jgi:hypothetical protein
MSIVLSKQRLLVLIILLGIFGSVILTTQKETALSTLLLFMSVAIVGLILCERLKAALNDPDLKVLGFFWLIKLAITFILLFTGWMPMLDPHSAGWGYDPQRYYYQAQELVENNWIFYGGLNYIGILYYYGALFFVFGHNPIIPALFNSFITLLATLYIIKFAYEVTGKRESCDWKIAWGLLLPEILWFDVITSRETLVAALIIFVSLTIGRLFIQSRKIPHIKEVTIIVLSLSIIAAVRTSMLLPIIGSIFIFLLLKKIKLQNRIYQVIIFAILLIGIVFTNDTLVNYIGGDTFDIAKLIDKAMFSTKNIATTADEVEYSKNSISQILLPEGVLQSIVFLPPRMILYILAPLPNISFSFIEMINGSWQAWQKLLTVLSSLINIIAMPYVLAATIQSIRNRKKNIAFLTMTIPFWTVFVAISGGNLIIHERYRVMATLLLWGCAWLGSKISSPQLIKSSKLLWYGTLLLGVLFYIFYKFILA